MGGNVHRRLEALERLGEVRQRKGTSERSEAADARQRMKAHLDRLAALRRGELGPEEAAEVEAVNAAVERRLASPGRSRRGEGMTPIG